MRLSVLAATLIATANLGAAASCMKDGTRTQSVSLSVEGKTVGRWEPTAGEVHRVRLPGGFEVGIQIEPATKEKYQELFARHSMRGIDELVKITLLDVTATKPTELSVTWGGVNSKQGFGPRGGANGVPQLRDQIELWFHKPVCITPETLAAN